MTRPRYVLEVLTEPKATQLEIWIHVLFTVTTIVAVVVVAVLLGRWP